MESLRKMENQGAVGTQSIVEKNQGEMENQGTVGAQGVIEKNQGEMENQRISRKEKRKAVKRLKRKRQRTEAALRRREEEETLLDDPEEQERLGLMEQEEAERNEREIRMWEERDGIWLEEAAERRRKEAAEEEDRRKILEELKKKEVDKEKELNDDADDDDDWEYAEGPAEITWQGNEIIVKKKRVRLSKKDVDQHSTQADTGRPTSNPLPPQSEAFSDCNASVISSRQAFAEVSELIPNLGTEQDKTHCPFHFKTGVCRFGQHCSRVHYYPEKSCTLLMKNMYNGPGLAWEQDEGLEHTDDEVARCYEEFYEDVHPEFQKYGEIVNFKVCRNGSFHLRGNVYVQYKSLDSAVLAYRLINGRYFAGKQITCEFVRVDRWKAAICGEYLKSGLKTCSHGTACNFIHCFRNPGGDYGWADWDKPRPRYWVKMMVTLFGTKDESVYDEEVKQDRFGQRSTNNAVTVDANRYHSRHSRSRESSYSHTESVRRQYDENFTHKSTHRRRHTSDDEKRIKTHKEDRYEDETHFCGHQRSGRSRFHDTDSDGDLTVRDRDKDRDRERCNDHRRKSSRWQEQELESPRNHRTRDSLGDRSDREGDKAQKHGYIEKSWRTQKQALGVLDEHGDSKYSTYEPDSDGDWSERDGDHNWDHDHMMTSSKYESEVSELSESHRNSRYRTDADSSHRNRQGDRYHNHRRKSSKHLDEVSEAAHDDKDKRKRTHDTDPTGNWSDGVGKRCHSKRIKRSKHRSDDHKETDKNVKDECHSEEDGVGKRCHSKRSKRSKHQSGDHKGTDKNVKDECHSEEFDAEKPDGQKVQKHSHSSRKDGSSKETISRVDFLSEDKKLNGNHETSSLDEHVRRHKSYNLDSGYDSDGNSDKQGNQEPEKHRKSRREKRNSHDLESGYYSGNTIDKGHSLESEKALLDKLHKCRDQEDYSKSGSRSSYLSTSLSNADSFKMYQESEEKDKKRDRQHRSSSHRQRSEK